MVVIVFSTIVFFALCANTIKYRGLLIFLGCLYISLSGLYVVSDMFTGAGLNSSVIYHLYTGVQEAGFSEYIKEIIYAIGFVVFVIILPFANKFMVINKGKSIRFNPYLSLPCAISLFFMAPWLGNYYEQGKLYFSGVFDNQDVSDEYVRNKSVVTNRKNIVIIYAESLERTYFNENKFPGLISHLTPIVNEGIEFTNIDNDGGGWTIAGLVNSQCGLPLSLPGGQGNNMGSISQFMPEAYCFGDILKSNGYDLRFIGGAKSEFAGKGTFITQHGYTSVDRDYFEKLIPVNDKNYSGWGVHDDHLLDYAYESFLELSRAEKPFVLSLLTLDTHHPKGHIPSTCANDKPYRDGKIGILNAVQCSDKLLARFIRKIQSSAAYKDTIIVLQSDHLAMSNDALAILNEDKESRKNTFVILSNDVNKMKIDRPGLLIDVGATILSLLGNNDGLGFGRNLLEGYHDGMSHSKFKKEDKNLIAYSSFSRKTWSFSTFSHGAEIKNNKIFLPDNKVYALPALFVLKDDLDIEDVYFDELNKHYLSLRSNTPYVLINSCNELGIERDGNCIVFGEKNKTISIHNFNNSYSMKNDLFDKKEMKPVKSKFPFDGLYSFNSSNGISIDVVYIEGDYRLIDSGVNIISSSIDGNYKIKNISDCNDMKKIDLDSASYKNIFISFQYETCIDFVKALFPTSNKFRNAQFMPGEYILLKVDGNIFKDDVLKLIKAPIKVGEVMVFDNHARVIDLQRPIFSNEN